MPRTARIVIPGIPHHVTQRGNRRQPVFFRDEDYELYKELLAECCGRAGVSIWSYCLMTNHVHLIAVPKTEDALARGIGEAHRRYTSEINRRKRWTGYLWQGRFASFAMDEAYTLQAARYVERNPVAEKMVRRAEDYAWSSTRAHIAGRDDGLVQTAPLRAYVDDWRAFLKADPADDFAAHFERHASSGWPLGEKQFLARLERRTGHPMQPAPRGRPRKDAA
ncbi:transposase [Mycoplana ramosa]|uniref:Transposase n=1 Tax=Mycoplana ramosa TaxID=40837 RepID=A0ABW3YY35_MYCRA